MLHQALRVSPLAKAVLAGVLLAGSATQPAAVDPIRGCDRPPALRPAARAASATQASSTLYLRRAVADLSVTAPASTDIYQAYFLIPVPFSDQAPILLTVASPDLIDYRFVRLTPPNVLVAARMKKARTTTIHWEAWVVVKENTYEGLPASAPIPTLRDIPDEVKPWLQATDCVQVDDPLVRDRAWEVRGATSDLMALADAIAAACYDIPWELPHSPFALDAYYALRWGGTCTGVAHAGAALFRANGVPARSLMVMPTWFNGFFDMHWIIDYYVPGYGWVKMETSGALNPYPPQDEVVTMACNPEDEFPVFYPMGIEGPWHTSDPVLGVLNPYWGQAHTAYDEGSVAAAPEDVSRAVALTAAVFSAYTRTWGLGLTGEQGAKLGEALSHQSAALDRIRTADVAGYLSAMHDALACYRQLKLKPARPIFADDFEGAEKGWTHGGTHDTWTRDRPSGRPRAAHSGASCWGTGFSGSYENDADSWLLSPPFDLSSKAGAYLDFWLYNWVEDAGQGQILDPLWMDVTTDGHTFVPLCSKMGGVNDDPEIPAVGGWSHLALDLTPYAGNAAVQVRFRFSSDAQTTAPGSYVDDVLVYGRDEGTAAGLSCTAGAQPASGRLPLAVQLTASVSGGTPPYTVRWEFGDGATSTELNPSHLYSAAGTYIATLTAEDAEGLTGTSSASVSVSSAGVRAPRLRL